MNAKDTPATVTDDVHEYLRLAALAMERDTSRFARALGALYLCADGENRAKLVGAFFETFEEFGKRASIDQIRTRV